MPSKSTMTEPGSTEKHPNNLRNDIDDHGIHSGNAEVADVLSLSHSEQSPPSLTELPKPKQKQLPRGDPRREDKKEEDMYPEKDTEHEILQNYFQPLLFTRDHRVYGRPTAEVSGSQVTTNAAVKDGGLKLK